MGKNGSKHECFLVNDHINQALEDQLWKKSKTGFNLANYNMNSSLSELSICLEEKQDNKDKDSNVPLKVELPPMKTNNDTGKVFKFDQSEEKEKGEKEQTESRLNIEEFECGVHFGGGENAKQEWSFTLYDFDGHGKITKEDLAGLLKALYDAVGSSIKIPNNGTKTLKLRLSVGQDSAQAQGQTVDTAKVKIDKNEKTDSPKKKDLLKNKENVKHKDSPKTNKKDITRLNNLTSSQTPSAKCNNETAGQLPSAAKTVGQLPSTTKSRLSSKEHQELAELVQENMERNHVRQLRRHHSDCRGCHYEYPHQKLRQRGPRTMKSPMLNNNAGVNIKNKNCGESVNMSQNNNPDSEDKPKESQDRRNYYLDLAGVENNTSKFQTAPQITDSPKTALTTELNNSSKFQPIKTSSALPGEKLNSIKHVRSRSHEYNERQCDNVRFESEQCQNMAECHLRSRSFDPQESSKSPNTRSQKGNPPSSGNKPVRYRPVSLPAQVPEAISPHYHRRHRHRDKDHNLAMQQVAEWIEREHTVNVEGDKIVIQRHEHHHVHEHHHHHHYHHYYEA